MSPEKKPRTPLDRPHVLASAVNYADRHGIDPLSMRALAAELGVVPMALYKHVSDKDDLRAGMIDLVIEEYVAPSDSLAWQDAVRVRLLSARDALLRHPWMRPALESAAQQTPTVLAHMNAVAGDLIGGGLSIDLTHHAMHALGYRIWGFNPEAFPSPTAPATATSADTAPDPERQQLMQQMALRYPHIVAIATDAAVRNPLGACDDQAEYEFTLTLLLDAFRRLHDDGWSSTP